MGNKRACTPRSTGRAHPLAQEPRTNFTGRNEFSFQSSGIKREGGSTSLLRIKREGGSNPWHKSPQPTLMVAMNPGFSFQGSGMKRDGGSTLLGMKRE